MEFSASSRGKNFFLKKNKVQHHFLFILVIIFFSLLVQFLPFGDKDNSFIFILFEIFIFIFLNIFIKAPKRKINLKMHGVVMAFGWLFFCFTINFFYQAAEIQLSVFNYFLIISTQVAYIFWAPYFEEVLFRRYLFGFLPWSSKATALLIPCGVFVLFHIKGNWVNVLAVAIMSIQLCYLYYWTNSIITSALVHFAFNVGFIFKEIFLTLFSPNVGVLISGTFGLLSISLIISGNFLIQKKQKLKFLNSIEVKICEGAWLLTIFFMFWLFRK